MAPEAVAQRLRLAAWRVAARLVGLLKKLYSLHKVSLFQLLSVQVALELCHRITVMRGQRPQLGRMAPTP